MTKTAKKKFHSGMDIPRVVEDEIEALKKNNDIKDKLNELAVGANFKLWAWKTIPRPDLNGSRYEGFVIGYIHRHDMEDDEDDHSISFKWDGDQVRVFVSPLSSDWVEPDSPEPAPVASVIADAAAVTETDPPGTTTPPPPLDGVGGNS